MKADPEKRWKAGQSGNPGGRPKGVPSLTAATLRFAKAHPERIDTVVAMLFDQAEAGNIRAAELLWDRLDGKVAQPIAMVPDTHIVLRWPSGDDNDHAPAVASESTNGSGR